MLLRSPTREWPAHGVSREPQHEGDGGSWRLFERQHCVCRQAGNERPRGSSAESGIRESLPGANCVEPEPEGPERPAEYEMDQADRRTSPQPGTRGGPSTSCRRVRPAQGLRPLNPRIARAWPRCHRQGDVPAESPGAPSRDRVHPAGVSGRRVRPPPSDGPRSKHRERSREGSARRSASRRPPNPRPQQRALACRVARVEWPRPGRLGRSRPRRRRGW